MRYGVIFIHKLMTKIDTFEDKRVYSYQHFGLENIPEKNSSFYSILSEHIAKEISLYDDSNNSDVEIVYETLIISHKSRPEEDFIAITSGQDAYNDNYPVSFITMSPGSTTDIETTVLQDGTTAEDYYASIEDWKNNSITLNEILKQYTDPIYDDLLEKFEYMDSDTVMTEHEIEKLKQDLENLKEEIEKNKEWTQQQIQEFQEILLNSQDVKPLTTKSQFLANLMTSTTNFIKKHPTTTTCIFYNLTTKMSSIDQLPYAYVADKAIQLGAPEDEIKRALNDMDKN